MFAPVVADNCDMEVKAACLWARLAPVDVVANEMHCADERPAEREDLKVVRRRAIGRGRYHRPTMAGITAHDSWGTRIVEARPARVDQGNRQSLRSGCIRDNGAADGSDLRGRWFWKRLKESALVHRRGATGLGLDQRDELSLLALVELSQEIRDRFE